MKLDPNEPILGKVPATYISPFPSNDSLLDAKYNQILAKKESDGNTIGDRLALINQGRAFSNALAIANKTKAVAVGDLLNDWLPKTAWIGKGQTGDIVKGLFAEIPWSSISTMSVGDISLALTNAGLNIAMTALSAIPVYGQIASGILKAGQVLYDLLSSKQTGEEYTLPFSEYSRDSDQDLIQLANDVIFPSRNWTDLFRPPFEIDAPWRFAVVDRKKNAGPGGVTLDASGFVFVPTLKNKAAWRPEGWGCIPNTFRVFGQIQQSKGNCLRRLKNWKGNVVSSTPIHCNEKLIRFASEDSVFPWKYQLTNCGDYFPSLAQLGAALWQQTMAAGNPDMYKINTYQLEYEWEAFFQNLYSTSNYAIKNQNLGVGPILGDSQTVASQMVEPFLCYKVNSKDQWAWGTPDFFRVNPYYHDKFFEKGPVPVELRNNCLFVEENLKKGSNHFWPYSTEPKQFTESKYLAGSAIKPASTQPPAGSRCIPYPPKEDANLIWASPYIAIIKPAILALRARQEYCLKATLVSAYLNLEYAAFKNVGVGSNPARTIGLAALFLDMQKELLKNDARFAVNLKDVKSLNPKYEEELRKSGVNNSMSQLSNAKFGLKAAVSSSSESKVPDVPPTTGGVPFEDYKPPRVGRNDSSIAPLLIGGAAIAGAGYYFLKGSRRK